MTADPDDRTGWSLTEPEREDIVLRAANGISSMCFFNERKVSDAVAKEAAHAIESKAYSRAKVESKTTTGSRPRCALHTQGRELLA
jgi:WPP domain